MTYKPKIKKIIRGGNNMIDMLDKDKLIKDNIGLVKKYAGKFSHRYCYDDLVQEGLIALFLASNKFDESKGIKFSTFATNYIINSIKRFLSINSRTIRLPINKISILNAYFLLCKEIKINNSDNINTYNDIAKKLRIKERELIYLINSEKGCISLDKIYTEDNNENNNIYKYLYVEDEQYNKVDEEIDNTSLIKEIFKTLSKSERTHIIKKYELLGYDEEECSDKESKHINRKTDYISRNAIKKIRKHKCIKTLKKYI
jgi:RNA polymerase sigma factor (sigma-70 family)